MEKLTKDDVVQLIYGSEDNDLAIKVLGLYEDQLKKEWLKSLHKETKPVVELPNMVFSDTDHTKDVYLTNHTTLKDSINLRDQEEMSK